MLMLTPTHRLILCYDISPIQSGAYYRYVLSEFVPAMQALNLHMIYAWQVVSSHRPERQLDFVCEGEKALFDALKSERFLRLERRLKTYTLHYSRKAVLFENRCQI